MTEKLTITQYLSGALVANGIRIIVSLVLSSYLQALSELFQVLGSWSMTILSGTVASYLLTKRMADRHLITGGIIGLYSYIVYVLISFLGITNQFEEMWVFLGYLLGGFLGGRLGEKGELGLPFSLPSTSEFKED
jgi:putative membrane protein (TIGR04086 family)